MMFNGGLRSPGFWRGLTLVCVLWGLLPNGLAAPDTSATPARFAFAVAGDVPGQVAHVPLMEKIFQSIELSDSSFGLFVGTVRAMREPCSDELFDARRFLFENSRKAIMLAPPGDLWIGCEARNVGGSVGGSVGSFDADERLARVREVFYGDPYALGQNLFEVYRQSEMARFRSYPENRRWQWGGILFVTLNLPTGNNNFQLGAGGNGEFEDRVIGNRVWLERAFQLAQRQKLRGLVIAVQADPHFELPMRAPDPTSRVRDGYYEFKLQLRQLAARYAGSVLLAHGGTLGFRVDRPLLDARGRPVPNVVRVTGAGSPPRSARGRPDTGGWLRVVVDPRGQHVFTVYQRRVIE